MTENNIKKTSISFVPAWQVCIMFLITFYGIFCAVWTLYMICGYPIWSFYETDMNVMRVCRIITLISTPFFAYIVFSQYRAGGIRQFAGMSIPIILMLTMIYCRQVADLFFLYDAHPFIRSFIRLIFPLTLLAFSIPLKPESAKKYFASIYIPLFILAMIILITWKDVLLSGYTMRSSIHMSKLAYIADSIWFGVHDRKLLNLSQHISNSFEVSTIGALLCILSMFVSLQKLQFTKVTQILLTICYTIGYTIGCTIIFFTVFKSIFCGFAVAGLFIAYSCKFWKSWRFSITLLCFLIITCILCCTVGYKDQNNLTKCFLKFSKVVSKNIDGFTSDINKVLTLDSENEMLTQNSKNGMLAQNLKNEMSVQNSEVVKSTKFVTEKSNILVENPYTLREKTVVDITHYTKLAYISDYDARVNQYILGIKAVLLHPLIGYSQFLILNFNDHFIRSTVHSNILMIFLATGLPGGILFLYIVTRGILDSIAIKKYIPEMGWLPCIFLFAFVANIFYTQCIGYVLLWVPLVAMRSCVKFNVQKIKQKKQDILETVQ